jgi:hypothetical protein
MSNRSDAFDRWLSEAVVPIARSHGLAGKGPTFRKRDGDNWILVSFERRRIDPPEAATLTGDAPVEFRIQVGISVTSAPPSWQPVRKGPPGVRDITIYSADRSLDPPAGDDWHVFVIDDPACQAALTRLIADGLGPALHGLGDTSARAILDRRLSVTGPLENLSPGAAEELLAMADSAGDVALRAEIVAALDRGHVPDPMDALRNGWVPPIGQIHPPIGPRRRTRGMLERLVRDLGQERVYVTRLAATLLGAWDDDEEALRALRGALNHRDGITRGVAALSLGHLQDHADATWQRAIELADDDEVGAWDVGAAIVLLSRVDSASRRGDAEAALDRLRRRSPAWSQDLRAFKAQLSTG